MSKTDIKIDIPEQLKSLLVDDWENVTKTQKVYTYNNSLL